MRKEDGFLQIEHLKKYYPVKSNGFRFGKNRQVVKAVDDVSLTIQKGEVIGLVGESGCGKSTIVNTILNLTEPTSGSVVFDGRDLYRMSKEELRKERKNIQIVFQDPFWSLNPRRLIKDIIGEPLKVQTKMNSEEILKRVEELLEMLDLPKKSAYMYPHEFSNGERQRIAIARALALTPKLVVLDEPTSSIDILSQVQILKLLNDLKDRFDLTYILISHDLSVVHYMSDRIVVMYLGKIVEAGDAEEVFSNPQHPYTQALFDAIPTMSTDSINKINVLKGGVPSAINVPKGCRFHTRCTKCLPCCSEKEPEMITLKNGVQVACHLAAEQERR
ncbi:MAG TPA: ABC transporter ATP-binding protein [Candidatus Choladousia intestinipullorum]|nr:ABC transporter ATP-binding protein [Candidatus Choladousia intestinipullorum]